MTTKERKQKKMFDFVSAKRQKRSTTVSGVRYWNLRFMREKNSAKKNRCQRYSVYRMRKGRNGTQNREITRDRSVR